MPRGKKQTKLDTVDVSPPEDHAEEAPKPRRRNARTQGNQAIAQQLNLIIDMLTVGDSDTNVLVHNVNIAVKHLSALREKLS